MTADSTRSPLTDPSFWGFTQDQQAALEAAGYTVTLVVPVEFIPDEWIEAVR